MKQLFFDDDKLFVRENIKRTLGKPELIMDSIYHDEILETHLSTGNIFKTEDGYRLLYQGRYKDRMYLFAAFSKDAVHFEPEDLTGKLEIEDRMAKNQIMKFKFGQEVAAIIKLNDENKYVMLMTDFDEEKNFVYDIIYTSEDLLHWELIKDTFWGDGCEPLTGLFYNHKKECYTIIRRPYWGIRSVGYSETKDWKTFSEFAPCVIADALDAPLTEIYGMKAFAYGDWFIGLTELFSNHKKAYSAKFFGGTEEVGLAYSEDGRYWRRSIRKPFLSGLGDENIEKLGYENKMLWISDMLQKDDEDLLLYTSASKLEHGHPYIGKDNVGSIMVYQLRKDGFICLENEDADKPALVATREKIWNGGELTVNLSAKQATVAIYESKSNVQCDNNMLGVAELAEGYTHDDCIPFSGDSKNWVPCFKNGKKLDDFKGKTIVIEIKLTNGKLYSIEGDYIDVFNTEAGRYRLYGVLPTRK